MKRLFAVVIIVSLAACGKQGEESVTRAAPATSSYVEQPTTFDGVKALAMKGNYQAQRNLSYGYSSRQYPGQQENQMLGCAWRIVIIKSGSEKVDETDVGNHDLYCNRLDKTSRLAAEAQAAKIMKNIQK